MGFMSRMAGTFDDKQRDRLLTIAAMDLASAKPSDRVYLAAILAELAQLNDNLERLTSAPSSRLGEQTVDLPPINEPGLYRARIERIT